MIVDHDAVMILFSKEQVRQRKIAHFLKKFGSSGLPEGPELAAMMRKFQFLVEGWDDEPPELYAIPELRKLEQDFHSAWPCWFFFCDLRTETLTMMTICLLPNLECFKRPGDPQAAVEHEPLDLLRFIEKNFTPPNAMMERAGMTEQDIYNRTKEVFAHFGLPYEAAPPVS